MVVDLALPLLLSVHQVGALTFAADQGKAIVGTLVVLKICDAAIGVRVDKQEEIEGLDVSQHGEEGYIFES